MIKSMFLADALNVATNQVSGVQNSTATSSSIWWCIGGIFVVLFILYKIGKRVDTNQANQFVSRVNNDLEHLLKNYFPGSNSEFKQQLTELWKHNPLVDFGSNILKVELILMKNSPNTVECQIKTSMKNDHNEIIEGTATRTYDWDYLPTEVSKILIRSGKKSETLVLYRSNNIN